MYNEKILKKKIEMAMENCLTMAGVARAIGMDYKTLRKYAIKFELFKTNQSGKNCFDKHIKDIVLGNVIISKTTLKKRLIDENILPYKCNSCKIDSWNNSAITLELDHIDGNKKNNKLSNLRLLCPNCHSQTITYRGMNKIFMNKKIIESEIINSSNLNQLCKRLGISNRGKETKHKLEKIIGYEIVFNNYPKTKVIKENIKKIKPIKLKNKCTCGKVIQSASKLCVKCTQLKRRKIERPDKKTILKEVTKLGYLGTGKKYGVSDNTIRKWLLH